MLRPEDIDCDVDFLERVACRELCMLGENMDGRVNMLERVLPFMERFVGAPVSHDMPDSR